MGVKVPFHPVYGASEARLFTRLMQEMLAFDDVLMDIEWWKDIDEHFIFSKLPIYLRMNLGAQTASQRCCEKLQSSSC